MVVQIISHVAKVNPARRRRALTSLSHPLGVWGCWAGTMLWYAALESRVT